jgi:hypothetical protein
MFFLVYRNASTDDPSTDDPSTDDPSTNIFVEFYNIDPHCIDFLQHRPPKLSPEKIGLAILVPTYLLQAYFWG